MEFKVIQTGSAGNCYILRSNSGETLILECGVNAKRIKQEVDFDFSNIAGCLVTHSHKDHCKGVNTILASGIDVYALEETHKEMQTTSSHRAKAFEFVDENGLTHSIGSFKVKPLLVKHDVPCAAFLIYHEECGKLLFLTDAFYCPYTFKDLNNVIIEANYSKEIIKKRFNQDEKDFLRNRILRSHMSLETCIDALKASNLEKVNKIVLIHLSDTNSDESLFKSKMIKEINREPIIAKNGLKTSMNLTPF